MVLCRPDWHSCWHPLEWMLPAGDCQTSGSLVSTTANSYSAHLCSCPAEGVGEVVGRPGVAHQPLDRATRALTAASGRSLCVGPTASLSGSMGGRRRPSAAAVERDFGWGRALTAPGWPIRTSCRSRSPGFLRGGPLVVCCLREWGRQRRWDGRSAPAIVASGPHSFGFRHNFS